MKKLLSVILIILCTVLCCNAVLSEDAAEVTALSDYITVTVNGASSPVTLVVLEPGVQLSVLDNGAFIKDIAVHFDQLVPDEDGKAVFSFRMKEKYKTGKYEFYIIGKSINKHKAFLYFDKDAKSDIIKAVNLAETTGEIREIITDEVNLQALTYNFAPFIEMLENKTDMSFVYSALLNHMDFNPDFPNDFIAYLTELSLVNYINETSDNGRVADEIISNRGILRLDDEAEAYLFGLFTGLEDAEKETVISGLSRDYADTSGAASDFTEKIFLNAVENMDYFKNLEALVKNVQSMLQADILNTYNKVSDKNAVLQAVSNENYTDIDDFCNAFITASRKQYNRENSTSGQSSSGGGGGDGGRYLSVTPSEDKKEAEAPADNLRKEVFTDLSHVSWAKDAIYSLYDKNIIHGKTLTEFFPDDSITRAEFIKLAVLSFDTADEYTEYEFSDVSKKDWSYPFICRAYELGIVKGTGENTVSPHSLISREDMAVIILRISEKYRISLPEAREMARFSDETQISDYAKEALRVLYRAGIINGVSEKLLSPCTYATRAQAARIIDGILKIKEGR